MNGVMVWCRCAMLGVAAMVFGGAAQAQVNDGGKTLPLYEVEAFAMGGSTPDYPGSDQNHLHGLALPWLTYRGDILRTDEKGTVRGRLVKTGRFELDVSASGSFPVSSSDNTARAGMPDLDWLGEVGPRARAGLYYWQNAATGQLAKLSLELPVRAVFSTDFNSVDYRGILVAPALSFDTNRLWHSDTGLKISAGPLFATERMADYFYQVDAPYVTASRKGYDASGGYLGSRLHIRVNHPLNDRFTLFGTSNIDYLGSSENEDSPLLKETTNYSLLLGFSVSLYQSDETVSVRR